MSSKYNSRKFNLIEYEYDPLAIPSILISDVFLSNLHWTARLNSKRLYSYIEVIPLNIKNNNKLHPCMKYT